MITANELLAASIPMRPPTAEESKRALQALGLDEEPMKGCSMCGEWKPLHEFYRKACGYNAACKTCVRARQLYLRSR